MVLFKKKSFIPFVNQPNVNQSLKAMLTQVSIHSTSDQSLRTIFTESTTYDLNENKVYFAKFLFLTFSTAVITL